MAVSDRIRDRKIRAHAALLHRQGLLTLVLTYHTANAHHPEGLAVEESNPRGELELLRRAYASE